MNIEQYYLDLRKHYESIKEEETLWISMDELSERLRCTKRNAQLLVHKMVDQKLIQWVPGKGRGNKSRLLFLRPVSEVILQKAKQLTLEKKLTEAWELMEQYHSKKYDFNEWLSNRFGMKHEGEKDILRYPFYRPILQLDPTFVRRRTEAHLVRQLFNTLVKYDVSTRLVIPDLAHFWESNASKDKWRFYLKKGVRFHHGKELTSQDIVFTFDRIKKESPFSLIKNVIESATAIEKYVVDISLTEPTSLFLPLICLDSSLIVPSDLEEIDQKQSFMSYPIGTGPFRVKKNDTSELILEAHEDYFEGRPHLDKIEIWVWPDYEKSFVKGTNEPNDIYFMDYEREHHSLTKLTNIEQGATFLTFNLQKDGPLQDQFLRKSIHYGIDRLKMVHELGGNREMPSNGFFPIHSKDSFESTFNLSYAKSYLARSNYKGELLSIYTYEMKINEQNGHWLVKELVHIGINVQLIVLPITELANHRILHKADMILSGEVFGDQVDLGIIEMFTFEYGFINNHLGVDQRRIVTETLEQCKKLDDLGSRNQALIKLQQQLIEDNQLIFLYHSNQKLQHDLSVNGVMLNAWGKVDFKNVWIKKSLNL
ncbi:ABC transporter substrate-binding protein [Cytobacillus sp. FJAT-54145]|uniref:ABC transporter substrate-binding protein n=1 Tax=Cytobacillus spartinae TaxID=3299023 RepID=A0ABW6K6V7_9BACI